MLLLLITCPLSWPIQTLSWWHVLPFSLDKALKLIPFPVSSWLTTLFSGFSASIDHISLTWLVDKTFKSWSNLTIFLLYFHIYFHMYMSPTFPYSSWFNLITCLLYFLYISPYVPMFPYLLSLKPSQAPIATLPGSGVLPVPWEKSEVKRHFSAVVETRAAVTAMRSGVMGFSIDIWLYGVDLLLPSSWGIISEKQKQTNY